MRAFVYILADMRHGQTYIGVTNDLVRRVYEHREGLVAGYTKAKGIKRLVWFEEHQLIGPFSAKHRSSAGTDSGKLR